VTIDGKTIHLGVALQGAAQAGEPASYGTTANAASPRSTADGELSNHVVQPKRLPAGAPSASRVAPPSRVIGTSTAASTGRKKMS
jgi:hypothetical protein